MEYKYIPNYEGLYKVDKYGNIYSCRSKKVLKFSLTKDGYKQYVLYKDKKKKIITAHKAVALAWIPNPNNFPIVNHKDENKFNCFVDNLEWCTYSYNNSYNGASKRRVRNMKKTVYQYNRTGELVSIYSSTKEASKSTGFHNGNICVCSKCSSGEKCKKIY